MSKSMNTGDPVPGIELFLEDSIDEKPIANGITDVNGGCRLPLPSGTFNVRAVLSSETSVALSSILVRIREPKSFIVSKSVAVPFDPGGSSPDKFTITLANKSESVLFEVLVLNPRSAIEQALLTGLFQRELQSASGAALMDEFIATTSTVFGSPCEVTDNLRSTTWPPPMGMDKSIVLVIETPAGRLQITIATSVRIVQGKPVLEAGGRQASSVQDVHALAIELHDAIVKSLTQVRGLPKGIDIILIVIEPAMGNGSKGGFAVGGFSMN